MTRRFAAVTTFSARGLEEYGRRMVASFLAHWAASVPLIVYVEGFSEWRRQWRVLEIELARVEWLTAFKARHANNPQANGRKRYGYTYRFDAVRFAHKTAAVIDAAEALIAHGEPDVLIWLDGDTVTHAPVTLKFLESLLPEGAAIAWLDREHMHIEAGFFMLNLRHPALPGILKTWRDLYTGGRLFQMREWHDSFVLQEVVTAAGVETASLSGEARNTMHPLARNPVMAARFDHLKGRRKGSGFSPEHAIYGEKSERAPP